GGLGDARVILPEPRHRVGVAREPSLKGQRTSALVHGDGRARGRVHADPDDLGWLETADAPRGVRERVAQHDLGALHVIRGMLPRQIGITAEDDAARAVLVLPDGSAHFPSAGGVHYEGADRVRAVIEAHRVTRAHGRWEGWSVRRAVKRRE